MVCTEGEDRKTHSGLTFESKSVADFIIVNCTTKREAKHKIDPLDIEACLIITLMEANRIILDFQKSQCGSSKIIVKVQDKMWYG